MRNTKQRAANHSSRSWRRSLPPATVIRLVAVERSPSFGVSVAHVRTPDYPHPQSTVLRASADYQPLSDLRQARRPALIGDGHQVAGKHLRRVDPGGCGARGGSPQGSRPSGRRSMEQAHARLSGAGAAISGAGRCDQRRLWLSRSEMPWLQHAPDCRARHRAATEGDANS